MKRSREIIGLSVISIQEGKELGVVKQLIIDAAEKRVAGLLIDDGKAYLGAKSLPYSAVTGIGEYAVTINSETDMTAALKFEALLVDDVQVIGSPVIALHGNIVGIVSEFGIDGDGVIAECFVETDSNSFSIPTQRVITYGKNLIIIATDSAASQASTTAVRQPAAPNLEVSAIVTESIEQNEPPAEVEPDALAKLFEEKQRNYMLGKRASRRIEAETGSLIIEQGEEITEAVLNNARDAGKFVELSMSIY